MAITDASKTKTSTLARTARATQPARPAQTASPAKAGSSNGNASHVDSFVPSSDRHDGAELRGANLAKSVFAAWGPSSTAASTAFKYDGVQHIDHTSSIGWKPGSTGMSPTQANQSITEGYKKLNSNMVRYLAGDPNGPKLPPLADWTAFGKYASREAGEQIRNLEDVAKFQTNGDPAAARRLAENMTGSDALKQGVGMGLNHGGNVAGGITNLSELGPQVAKAVGTPDALLGALTKGNNGIYDNFAPAYDAFLKGEANGGKGMEALRKAGYTPGSEKDPQGFFTKALGGYKEARELGLKAQQEKDPAKRQALLDKREKLVGDGNLNLGNQEQMHIIQRKDIFGDPKVSENIRSLGGTMTMHDANGTHKLLPNGGDWSDFATRMGYKEVPAGSAGSQQIKDLDGKVHHYAVDPGAKGTIADYFTQNGTGAKADKLNNGSPAPLYGPGMSNAQLAGQLSASVPRVAGDLTSRASKALDTNAALLQTQGAALSAAGQAVGGVPGFALQVAGHTELLLGQGGQVLAGAGKQASQSLANAGTLTQAVVPGLLEQGSSALESGAKATTLYGKGLQASGNADVVAGQSRGGVGGFFQATGGEVQKMTGSALEGTVQAGRDTVQTVKAAAPVVVQKTVQTFHAVANDVSSRVAPWDPRAKWAFGLTNPFAS